MQMQYNQFHITSFYRKDGRQLTLLWVLELCYCVKHNLRVKIVITQYDRARVLF